jgi:flavodoxin
MKKTLVVCYTLTGMSGGIAHTIAHGLGAELELLDDTSERGGPLGYLRSGLEAIARGLPTIRARRAPGDYELVVVGTPVWAGTMSSPMRSYLFMHRGQFSELACFCTSTGYGAESTLAEMQALADVDAVATLSVTERDIVAGRHDTSVRDFIAALRRAAGVPVAAE